MPGNILTKDEFFRWGEKLLSQRQHDMLRHAISRLTPNQVASLGAHQIYALYAEALKGPVELKSRYEILLGK